MNEVKDFREIVNSEGFKLPMIPNVSPITSAETMLRLVRKTAELQNFPYVSRGFIVDFLQNSGGRRALSLASIEHNHLPYLCRVGIFQKPNGEGPEWRLTDLFITSVMGGETELEKTSLATIRKNKPGVKPKTEPIEETHSEAEVEREDPTPVLAQEDPVPVLVQEDPAPVLAQEEVQGTPETETPTEDSDEKLTFHCKVVWDYLLECRNKMRQAQRSTSKPLSDAIRLNYSAYDANQKAFESLKDAGIKDSVDFLDAIESLEDMGVISLQWDEGKSILITLRPEKIRPKMGLKVPNKKPGIVSASSSTIGSVQPLISKSGEISPRPSESEEIESLSGPDPEVAKKFRTRLQGMSSRNEVPGFGSLSSGFISLFLDLTDDLSQFPYFTDFRLRSKIAMLGLSELCIGDLVGKRLIVREKTDWKFGIGFIKAVSGVPANAKLRFQKPENGRALSEKKRPVEPVAKVEGVMEERAVEKEVIVEKPVFPQELNGILEECEDIVEESKTYIQLLREQVTKIEKFMDKTRRKIANAATN